MAVAYFLILSIFLLPILAYGILLFFQPKKELVKSMHRQENVSIILPCYNEELYIEEKINSLIQECNNLGVQYEIIVISDGSNDLTNSILQKFNHLDYFHCHLSTTRKGKASALNYGLSKAKYPILVFADSRQRISLNSISNMLMHFSNPDIGAVSSILRHEGEKSLIRKTINSLKILESKGGSTMGVYGGLYSVRKECLQSLPENTILDDLLISIYVLLKGKRVIVEPSAIIYDVDINQYYSTKRIFRLINGLIQLPRKNWTLVKALSIRDLLFIYVQKYAKLSLPFLLILLSILAIGSYQIFIFHLIAIGSILSFIACLNIRSLLRVFRIFGLCLFFIRTIKKYNTNLWTKSLLPPLTKHTFTLKNRS